MSHSHVQMAILSPINDEIYIDMDEQVCTYLHMPFYIVITFDEYFYLSFNLSLYLSIYIYFFFLFSHT